MSIYYYPYYTGKNNIATKILNKNKTRKKQNTKNGTKNGFSINVYTLF